MTNWISLLKNCFDGRSLRTPGSGPQAYQRRGRSFRVEPLEQRAMMAVVAEMAPAPEVMLRIAPLRRSSMPGSTARMHRKLPRRLTSTYSRGFTTEGSTPAMAAMCTTTWVV